MFVVTPCPGAVCRYRKWLDFKPPVAHTYTTGVVDPKDVPVYIPEAGDGKKD